VLVLSLLCACQQGAAEDIWEDHSRSFGFCVHFHRPQLPLKNVGLGLSDCPSSAGFAVLFGGEDVGVLTGVGEGDDTDRIRGGEGGLAIVAGGLVILLTLSLSGVVLVGGVVVEAVQGVMVGVVLGHGVVVERMLWVAFR
jgi:hypothetical protein